MSRYEEMVSIEELYARRLAERAQSPKAGPLHESEAPAEQWGVGKEKDAKAFDRGRLEGGTEYDLIFGEHPHSRQDDRIYARFENGEVHGFNGHRTLVRIEIEMRNYLKDSWLSGSEIRKGGVAKLFLDGDLVHSFFAREPAYALQKMQGLLVTLSEHASGVWLKQEREKLIGHKVFYDNVPGVVKSWYPDQGAVVIEAVEGRTFPKPVWWDEDDGDDWEWKDAIKVDLLSEKIWWFRDEPE